MIAKFCVASIELRLGRLKSTVELRLKQTMTMDEFQRSLEGNEPPAAISPALTALWWDARGNWERAHSWAQDEERGSGAWVHASLHRKEGDRGNAGYWYRRAGKSFCEESLPDEWLSITQELIRQESE
jgi:hypothetical protein